ncbi:MAG: hypothetical protein JAY90_12045 [Candidatus Thiodiazotropha lotti]|nr:hypothetical protein [Candidatus Thiodiazotropha lotti]
MSGKKNGGVLMWVAIDVEDPQIIEILVARGADVIEGDTIFTGTPLTGAAGYSTNPTIIHRLITLSADINQQGNSHEDALMIEVQYHHLGLLLSC